MGTKIIIEHLSGSRRGKRTELDPCERVTFGRHPANDVAFDPHRDLAASTHHAELRREADAYVLVDVGSSNGTYLSGHKVARLPLKPETDYDIEFGEGGPRCRIFIGDPQAKALPATMVGRPPAPAIPVTISKPISGAVAAQFPVEPTKSNSLAHLWRRAVGEAQERQGGQRSTVFMRSMLDQALHRSTRRLKLVLIGTTTAFLAAMTVLIVFLVRRGAPRAEVVPPPQTPVVVAAAPPDAGKATVPDEIDLEPGAKIAEENVLAIYLIAYTDEDGEDKPLCTAFAVTAEVLATNAHCLEAMHEVEGRGRTAYVVRNHAPKRYAIKWARWHHDYRGAFSPDVALVAVDGTMEKMVRLADEKKLFGLRAGAQVFVYGFPGVVADPRTPEASVLNGIIGRITRYGGEPGEPADMFLIQHSAPTSAGTSGSPVFNARGEVVAVNEGIRKDSEKGAVAPGLSLAVRMDALFPVLDDNVSGWREGTVNR